MEDNVSKSDEYIVDESPELSLGESENWTGRLSKAFPAFKHKNYQLYFGGQLISMIGSWLQNVAQAWLVLQLSHSALWVGTIVALNNIPILLFALFGGVIVDRLDKKHVIIFTQTAFMIFAFLLGILTITHQVTIWQVAVISFLSGIFNALDNPARQAFVVDLVGKEDLHSAIALNSSIFNGARVIGPAIAGVLIATVGTGGAFILNGVSFLAVIIALIYINIQATVARHDVHPIQAIKEGLQYVWLHPVIKALLIFAGISSIFGWSYSTIMPVIAERMLHQDAAGLGVLYVASGVGALVASMVVSIFGKRISRVWFILGGNGLFSLSILAFSFTHTLTLACPFLALAGFSLLIQFSTVNTTIQTLVKDSLRGRVMSIYTLVFIGLSPFGSFEVGYLADHFGVQFAIRFGAIIVFLAGVALYLYRHKIRAAYQEYQKV